MRRNLSIARSPSKRLVRVLRPIVAAATDLVSISCNADLVHRRRIGTKPVGDDAARSAVLLQEPLEKLQRPSLVPLHRDHRLHDLAFMVDGAPEVAELAVDLHKDFIQVPPPLRIAAHARDTSLADLAANIGPNRFHPNRTVSWLMSIPRSADRSSRRRCAGRNEMPSGPACFEPRRAYRFRARSLAQTLPVPYAALVRLPARKGVTGKLATHFARFGRQLGDGGPHLRVTVTWRARRSLRFDLPPVGPADAMARPGGAHDL